MKEIWNLCDGNHKMLARKSERGSKLSDYEYHLVLKCSD